jgi:anthranilate synthase component 1
MQRPETRVGNAADDNSSVDLPFRTLQAAVPYMDPVMMFQRVCRGANTLLLESAEIDSKRHLQSFLLTAAAVRFVCRGREVVAEGLTVGGRRLLAALAANFRAEPMAGVELAGEVNAGTDSVRPTVPKVNSRSDGSAKEAARLVWRFGETSNEQDEDARLLAPFVFEPLRRIPRALRMPAGEEARLFVGGMLAYDLVELFEPLPALTHPVLASSAECPDYVFYVAEQLVHFDHVRQTATATQLGFGEVAREDQGLDELLAQLSRTLTEPAADDLPAVKPVLGEPEVDLGDEQFCRIVERLKEEVFRGVVFQCVPSRSFRLPCPSPLRAYRRLRKTNPSPYMFYLQDEDFILFGASPETAVKFTAIDRMVELCPIAGTRPRGFGPDGQIDLDLDGRIELELRTDQKELAEHLMLVDLARNDLARICEPGTRHVAQLLRVDRYSHVMHLVSRVKGKLKAGLDGLHAYQACMNMGTLTGAPKVQAMQLIRQLEGQRRGSYGGAVGYFSGSGDFETCIVIRSAFVQGGVARIQAGAGVVHDSDPQAEANETRGKAQAVVNAVRQAHLEDRPTGPQGATSR